LFRFLEESEEGDAVAILERLCHEHPRHSDALRAAVAALDEGGLVDHDATRGVIGGFRLLRQLGAGGMGVVHLAREMALGRLVALKLVRPEQVYFESARERFRREVESSARLSHPGIAAVYSFGEERGVPYFAQEYVPGASLDAALRALDEREAARLTAAHFAPALRRAGPAEQRAEHDSAQFFTGTWEQLCARIGLAAAEALEHAVSRGVLHRDVKPSNLLLTPSGRVVLVDFGLATIADAAKLTRTGSVLGSMPYMAPEVLDGGDATVASDVYSLGVTLYELATLSLPFVSNRAEELRRQILAAEPLRPRQRNRELSRDFETIVACALDRAPSRRYASFGALAADLRALLEQRPIAARPLGPGTRVARAIARRPAAFIAAAASGLLVIGGPVVFGVVQQGHRARLEGLNRELNDALTRERSATARAEANYTLVVDTVDHLMQQFSDRAITRFPALAPLRLAAIERAATTFETLRAQRPGDWELGLDTALAHRARGDALYDLRRLEESLAAQRLQAEQLAALCNADGAPARLFHELGVAHSRIGRTLGQLRRHTEAVEASTAAVAAADQAAALAPAELEFALARAAHRNNLAMNLGDAERFDEARAMYDRCIAECEALLGLLPAEPRLHEVVARALRHRYGRLMVDEDAPGRLAALRRSREHYERALALEPGYRGLREDIVHLDYDLAGALVAIGELDAARALLEPAARTAGELAEAYPELTAYLSSQLECSGLLAHIARLQGAWEDARTAMGAVAEAGHALAVRHGSDIGYFVQAVTGWTNYANFVVNSPDLGPERYSQCLAALASAEHWFAKLDTETLEGIDGRRAAQQLAYNRAVAEAQLGQCAAAEASAARVAQFDLEGAFDARLVADAWCEVRNAYARLGSADDAVAAAQERAEEAALIWLARAVARGYTDRAELDSTPALDPLRADPRFIELMNRLPAVPR